MAGEVHNQEGVVTEENAQEVAEREYKAEREAAGKGEEPSKVLIQVGEGEETAEVIQQKADKELLGVSDEDIKSDKYNDDQRQRYQQLKDEELLTASEEEIKTDKFTDAHRQRRTQLMQDVLKAENDERQRLLTTADDKLNDKEKVRKQEIIKEQQDADQQTQTEVKAFAGKHKISEEDAKATLQEIDKVKLKYEADPVKLSQAYLFQQRENEKLKTQIKDIRDTPAQSGIDVSSNEKVLDSVDKGLFKHAGKTITREMLIEGYREEHKETVEKLEDEQVLQLAVGAFKGHVQKTQESFATQFKEQAKQKREDFVKNLPEVYTRLGLDLSDEETKRTETDIKTMLDEVPAGHILSDVFKIDDYIFWSLGRPESRNADIASAKQSGFNLGFAKGRGGKITSVTGPSGTLKTGEKTPTTPSLTPVQQQEARDMFPQATSDEEAFKDYAEVMGYNKQLKNKNKGVKT